MEGTDDDDMIMVIVGDVDESLSQHASLLQDLQESSAEVKVKPVSDDEIFSHVEFIEDNFSEDEKWPHEQTSSKSVPDKDLDSNTVRSFKRRKKQHKDIKPLKNNSNIKMKPHKSYIDSLIAKFPKLSDDEDKLVELVFQAMKQVKPPKPPPDYCDGVKINDTKIRYNCGFCSYSTVSETQAVHHYYYKHGEPYLVCFACGITHKIIKNLYRHEKYCKSRHRRVVLRARGMFLGVRGRGRPFVTKRKFGGELQDKPKEKYYCSQCPAVFRKLETMEGHENSHLGLRPYQCHHCASAYTSEASLQYHLRIHSGKKFICDYCSAEFTTRQAMKSHIYTHVPWKPLKCKWCGHGCMNRGMLRVHVDQHHLHLPPNICCPVCPKRYRQSGHVRAHMQLKHGLTVFTRRMLVLNNDCSMKPEGLPADEYEYELDEHGKIVYENKYVRLPSD